MLIAAFLLQFGSTVWWVANIDIEVKSHRTDITDNTRRIDELSRDANGVAVGLAGVRATLAALVVQVERLNNRLDNGGRDQ